MMDSRYSDVLVDVVRQQGFEDFTISVDRGSAPGGNFLGEIMRSHVTGERNGQTQTSDLIIKVIPRNQVHEQMKVYNFFKREVYMYHSVLSRFDRLQDQLGVQDKYTHCVVYKTRTDKSREVMIMNDLAQLGFVNSAIGRNLDLEHATFVMKRLAQFHALSFAMKYHNPDDFHKIAGEIDDLLLTDKMNPFIEKVIHDSTEHAMKVLEDPVAVNVVKDILVNRHEIKNQMFDIEDVEPYSVICHGDLWTTNILFKYKDEKVQDLIFLDWQGSRYHSPVTDLYFVLFSSLRDEVRSENFDELMNIYYSSLSESIRDLKCDPDKLFPKDVFRNHLKKYSKLSMMVMFIMLPVFTSVFVEFDPEAMDFSKDHVKGIYGSSKASETYINRVNTMVKDLIDSNLV